MGKEKRRAKTSTRGKPPADEIAGLRIIGGRNRGRRLQYSGDPRTRPMKDRLREAVFNLLGPVVRGAYVIDLFAGTGALALEALSRGAAHAVLIEQHRPTAQVIRQNVAVLGLEQQAEIVTGSAFVWFRRGPAMSTGPWAVFCSPPYDFYVERVDEMRELISGMIETAPASSIFIVEADSRFDFQTLPEGEKWNLRSYPPAVVGIYRKE